MSRSNRSAALSLVVLLSLAATACRRSDDTRGAAAKQTQDSTSRDPGGMASDKPKTIRAPQSGDAGIITLNAKEKQDADNYMRALAKGRKATRDKDFSTALAAFDDALRIRPHDVRALGERGYARVMAKDLDNAERDLKEARERAGASDNISSIVYNLGLVAKERGQEDKAKELFEQAKSLRQPGNAKQAKAKCLLDAKHPNTRGVAANDWKGVWNILVAAFKEHIPGQAFPETIPANATDDQIRAKLSGGRPDTHGAWVIQLSGAGEVASWYSIVAKRPTGGFVVFPCISVAPMNGICSPGENEVSLSAEGMLHASVTETQFVRVYMCQTPKRERVQLCTGEDNEVAVGGSCAIETAVFREIFIDAQRGILPLEVTESYAGDRPEARDRPKYVFKTDGVLVTGKGCNETIAYGGSP